ncbi:hypothetical protein [Psychromonas sp.]|uniref:hypothetical protein n=1 Tax=Psychromonas sp. TaxID=1884585 RepID=UPI0035654234
MSTYLILFATIAIIYYLQIHKRPPVKTDWEKLPDLADYKKLEKSVNEEGQLCCRYCANKTINKRLLQSKKENPDNTKHYHACSECKIVLWRSVNEGVKEQQ